MPNSADAAAADVAPAKTDPLKMVLRKPIVGHDTIREIRLRRPSAREILRHGYPYTVQSAADGRQVFIEDNEAIAEYCEACIRTGDQDVIAVLDGLCMEDTLELRERVIGFFIEAEVKKRASAT